MRPEKLSLNEKKVLSFIHLNAAASYVDIAKNCGIRSHTARNVVKNLHRSEVIVPCVIVNFAAIGLLKYHVYFQLTPSENFNRESILRFFSEYPQVSWFCDFIGEYNFAISLVVRNPAELDSALQDILIHFDSAISRRDIALDTSWTYFGKKYIHQHESVRPIQIGYSDKRVELDVKDKTILSILAKNCFISQQELAASLNLPLSTVNNRLNALKKKKVLAGFVYWINYSKIKVHAYRVLFNVGGLSDSSKKKITKYCRNHKNIVSLIFTCGSWDLELGIDLEEKYDFHTIVSDIKSLLGSSTFSVTPLMRFDDIKWNTIPTGGFDI